MPDATYNGWSNYETWAVNLWIDNSEGSQDYWSERARECLKDADFDKEEAVSSLADEIENEHEEAMPEVEGVFSDLLRAAVGSVDWREVARSMLDDITVYSAGWNMPGYMPDSEPAMFLDCGDARAYISDEMDNASQDEEDAEAVEALEKASNTVL
jgi:hypothetical protein